MPATQVFMTSLQNLRKSLSLLLIESQTGREQDPGHRPSSPVFDSHGRAPPAPSKRAAVGNQDRKSTRLNSSHVAISYAVFCLKKRNIDCRRAIYSVLVSWYSHNST